MPVGHSWHASSPYHDGPDRFARSGPSCVIRWRSGSDAPFGPDAQRGRSRRNNATAGHGKVIHGTRSSRRPAARRPPPGRKLALRQSPADRPWRGTATIRRTSSAGDRIPTKPETSLVHDSPTPTSGRTPRTGPPPSARPGSTTAPPGAWRTRSGWNRSHSRYAMPARTVRPRPNRPAKWPRCHLSLIHI